MEPPVVLMTLRPCQPCGEVGVLPSEEWDDYRRWAADQGITEELDLVDAAREYFVDVRGRDLVPPQSKACPDCEGTGTQRVPLPLEDLAVLLGDRVNPPALEGGELRQLEDPLRSTLFSAAAAAEAATSPEVKRQHLRVTQEAAEAIRSVRRLGPRVVER